MTRQRLNRSGGDEQEQERKMTKERERNQGRRTAEKDTWCGRRDQGRRGRGSYSTGRAVAAPPSMQADGVSNCGIPECHPCTYR